MAAEPEPSGAAPGETASSAFATGLQQPFRALRHTNFRVYWVGQWVSVIGTWMQTTALSWLLYRLTNSPAALGFLTLARFGPSLLVSPLAGVVVDRFGRRQLVLVTQAASLLQATVLAALTLGGVVQVWQLLLLAFLQGLVDTLDMPARQTLQVDLVGVADLQSAVSLNSSAFNVSRMVGPVLGGALIAAYGEGVCFAVNAVSYLAVLGALAVVRVPPPRPAERRSVLHELGEGLAYVWRDIRVRCVLVAMAVTSGVGLAYTTVLPVLARDVLGAGAQGYGVLLAGAGLGAVVGALAAAARPPSVSAVRVNFVGLAVVGVGLVALGLSRSLALATAFMVALGLAVAVQMSTTNGFLQTTAPPALRGRVVAIYIWLFAGLSPVGGMVAGLAVARFGVTVTAVASGLVCVGAAVLAMVGYTWHAEGKACK